MKKALIITFLAVLAMTMASCNWDPTDWGNGNGNGGNGGNGNGHGGDHNSVVVRAGEGHSFKTPCDFVCTVVSISVKQTAPDSTDINDSNHFRPLREVVVIIQVAKEDGTTETITLTNKSPRVEIGDCVITLMGVEPHFNNTSDTPTYVAVLGITEKD
jgi:hypothetical protein